MLLFRCLTFGVFGCSPASEILEVSEKRISKLEEVIEDLDEDLNNCLEVVAEIRSEIEEILSHLVEIIMESVEEAEAYLWVCTVWCNAFMLMCDHQV